MMSVREYLTHQYILIGARSRQEAEQEFARKRGYIPVPVLGAANCTDAIPSNFCQPGYYLCALRREQAEQTD